MSTISPQGYSYGQDPKSDNPFWSDEEVNEQITATASVDNSTGTPSVDVTKNGFNFDFAFKNLKGEKGDRGEQGEPGKDGTDGINGTNGTNGTDGTNGISPVVTATGNTGSGELAGTITGADQTVINVYNGAQGETGSGTSVDTSQFVTDVSVVNTNGVYDIKQTKNGVQSDVGQIDVPDTTNLLAEITDSVVENTTNGYDFHTIKETENNGTQNDVGKFYIARKQITALNIDGSFTTVDQNGNESYNALQLSGGSTNISNDTDIFTGTWLELAKYLKITKDMGFGRIAFIQYRGDNDFISITGTNSSGETRTFNLPGDSTVTKCAKAYALQGDNIIVDFGSSIGLAVTNSYSVGQVYQLKTQIYTDDRTSPYSIDFDFWSLTSSGSSLYFSSPYSAYTTYMTIDSTSRTFYVNIL